MDIQNGLAGKRRPALGLTPAAAAPSSGPNRSLKAICW